MAQRGISFWSIIVPAGKEVVQELDNEENLAQVCACDACSRCLLAQ